MKASASTLLLPSLILSAAPNKYGILGQKAPELKLSNWIDKDGQTGSFSLSEHLGKFIFIELWQAWCPGCHKHGFPSLKKITDALVDNPLFIPIAIQTTFEGYDVNTPDKMREIQLRYDLPIIMGHDAGNEDKNSNPVTMQEYRSGGTPWAILISPTGIVLHNDFGVNPQGVINYINRETKKRN